MATFYVGYRRVLKGRSSAQNINTYTGKVGVYSNWSIYNPSHVLDGAPDKDHVPGEGRFPGNVMLSRKYVGLDKLNPLDNPGSGARQLGARYRPLEFKGLDSSRAMGNPGHASRPDVYTYSEYSNFIFHGLPSAQALTSTGHAHRAIGAVGTAATFGEFDPYIYKGVSKIALGSVGRKEPAPHTAGVYGFEDVLEWFGVPSAKAL